MTDEIKEERADQENTYPYMVSVRFHNSPRPYSFGTEMEDLNEGDQVIVETSQGIELGECAAAPLRTDRFPPSMPLKPILRRASEKDIREYEENARIASEAFDICQQEINDLGLSMNLQSADYMLDRSKILFIYVAEQRVDFRELLRRLNYRLHCKIELRQIGERDKAKMIGGIGMCGRECCCTKFKNRFDVISINMAKTQLLALNVEKLSGMCGKLMCCLKYENDQYKEMTEGLPKMGAHVEYEGQLYKVTSMNVMTNEARIENSDTYQLLSIDDLKAKAVVRKGVMLAKGTGKGPKRNGGANTAPVRPSAVRRDPLERKPDELGPSEISFAASPAFQGRNPQKPAAQESDHRPARSAQPQKSGNRSRRGGQGSRSGRNPSEAAKPSLKEAAKNNPNVTVRSFKSSKTKAAESKGEQK